MTTATIQSDAVAGAIRDTAIPRRRTGRRRSDNIAGWAFVAPFVIVFVLFLIWPLIQGLYLSFTDRALTGAGGQFVGFANYLEAFGDADMWSSLGNTVLFTVMSTIPLVVIALVFAGLVERGLPGQWLWRLSFFLPYLLASTVASQIFIWIFNPQLGAANNVLKSVGLPTQTWLQSPQTAMLSVVIETVWWTIGFNFLLYISALQNIPGEQYEASSLDGAGKWRQFRSITLPQLGPITVLIVMLQILASLKLFDQVYQMTAGGPNGTTRSIVQYIFESGLTGYRFGYSSAISYIFFVIVVIVSLIQLRLTAARRAR